MRENPKKRTRAMRAPERRNYQSSKNRSKPLRPSRVPVSILLNFSPKSEPDRSKDERERHDIVPAQSLSQIDVGEDGEHHQCDDFLDDLELVRGKLAVADSIRRHLEAVFQKRDQPAHHDDQNQRPVSEL